MTLARLPYGVNWLRRFPAIVLAIFDQSIVSLAGFVFMLAAARCLPLAEFGVFSLCWIALMFVGNLHNAIVLQPLSVLFSEYCGEGEGRGERYLVTLNKAHLFMWVMLVVVFFVAIMLPEWAMVIILTSIAALLRVLIEYERRVSYVFHDSARAMLIDLSSFALLIIFSLFSIVSSLVLNIEYLLIAASISSVLGWLISVFLLRAHSVEGVGRPIGAVFREHWKFGKWVLVSALAMYVGSNLYPFLIAGYLGLDEVAALAGARVVVGLTHPIMVGMEAYFLPKMRVTFLEDGWIHFLRYSMRVAAAMFLLLTPLLFSCAAAPDLLIDVFVGSEYIVYSWILQWFAVLYVLVITTKLLSMISVAIKEPRAGAVGYMISTAVTVLIGPFVVKTYGIEGAILAMAFNSFVMIISMGLCVFVISRNIGMVAK